MYSIFHFDARQNSQPLPIENSAADKLNPLTICSVQQLTQPSDPLRGRAIENSSSQTPEISEVGYPRVHVSFSSFRTTRFVDARERFGALFEYLDDPSSCSLVPQTGWSCSYRVVDRKLIRVSPSVGCVSCLKDLCSLPPRVPPLERLTLPLSHCLIGSFTAEEAQSSAGLLDASSTQLLS